MGCSAHISQHQESLHKRFDRPIVKHELIRKKEQVGCLFLCIRPTGDAFRVFTVSFAFVVQASTSCVGVAITVRLSKLVLMSVMAFLNPFYLRDHAGRSEQVLFYLLCVAIVKLLLLLRAGLRGIPGAADTTRTTTQRSMVSLVRTPDHGLGGTSSEEFPS